MNKRINPILSKIMNLLIAQIAFRMTEYYTENLTSNSYIFAPNHTSNFDGYVIWSLLSKYRDISIFMYKEFWEHYPHIASLLLHFNVYPITRDKVVLSELKNELIKLKSESHSLIIFPDGRHVDPKLALNFEDIHLETIPLGAFYLSALSSKQLVPVFIEPLRLFQKNACFYGNPIDPNEFDIISSKNKINKKNIPLLAEAWLKELNRLQSSAPSILKRPLHEYTIEKDYCDASGTNYYTLSDPNAVVKYLYQLKKMQELSETLHTDDVLKLGTLVNLKKEEIDYISSIYETYKKHLLRPQNKNSDKSQS